MRYTVYNFLAGLSPAHKPEPVSPPPEGEGKMISFYFAGSAGESHNPDPLPRRGRGKRPPPVQRLRKENHHGKLVGTGHLQTRLRPDAPAEEPRREHRHTAGMRDDGPLSGSRRDILRHRLRLRQRREREGRQGRAGGPLSPGPLHPMHQAQRLAPGPRRGQRQAAVLHLAGAHGRGILRLLPAPRAAAQQL